MLRKKYLDTFSDEWSTCLEARRTMLPRDGPLAGLFVDRLGLAAGPPHDRGPWAGVAMAGWTLAGIGTGEIHATCVINAIK
jgi:hypothetical protein